MRTNITGNRCVQILQEKGWVQILQVICAYKYYRKKVGTNITGNRCVKILPVIGAV